MPANILVCVKQVMDPETPMSQFKIDSATRKVLDPQGIPPVLNGFDENAMEAALRLKENDGATVSVVSIGSSFVMDVIKKPLSMGADELTLLQDAVFDGMDAFGTAKSLASAIQKMGEFDLILCGRQASDFDQAQVPLGIAEILGVPCITMASDVQIIDGKVRVERKLPDGYEVLEAALPAVVTVSNELAPVRYPTLRNIMQASRKQPNSLGLDDIGLDTNDLNGGLEIRDLYIPISDVVCEFIEGDDDEDAGRKLALKLREAKLI
jgi:electron transfer flavoprotein beta subunit